MSIQLARANFALGKPTTTPWLETITPRQIAMLLTWTGDTTKNKEQKRDYYLWIDVIEAACQRGELASTAVIERRPALFDLAYDPYRDDAPEYREVTSYHNIKPLDVARWLEGQDQPPGELLEAWFTSQGVGVAAVEMVAPPAPAKKESDVERQDRRLQMCIDDGLKMDKAAIHRLPDGVGKVAETDGVSRQTFSEDVKEALRRKYPEIRPNLKAV